MNKSIIAAVTAAALAASLAGCTPGNNTMGSTAVGAAAGGLLAGALSRGNVAGIAAGALIGGSLGYIVGRKMDQQDRVNMRSAIINTPVNQQATWTNTQTDTTYVVRPVRNYAQNGQRCREYMTKVKIDGQWRSAYGRACKTPSGWKIMR